MTGEIQAGSKVRSMNPQKFAMWLFLVSVTMIFISLSSGYVVQKAAKELFVAELPSLFFWTTLVILASSVTMHMAYIFAKRNNIKNLKISLGATLILAIVFMYGQWEAWLQMIDMEMHLVSQNSLESFIYIFSGLHVIHLIGAVVFLLIVIRKAFIYQIHSKSMLRIEMCTTFWHFLGGLWLYLYLFLIFIN